MSELPVGWAECLIGEVTHVVAGGTPPSKDPSNFTFDESGIPWVTPADLSGYRDIYISRGTRNLTEKGFASCSAVKMPAGSVLFSSRAPIGYVAIAANETTTNQGFKSFALPESLNSHFVYYYLKHIKPVAESMATGTTFKELSGAATAKLPLVVAPIPEQTRIADKLDAVLARVGACRDRLDRVPCILKRFRQSVLAAATSGKLSEDWRAEQVARMQPQAESGNFARDAAELRYHVTASTESNGPRPNGLDVIAFDARAKASMLSSDASLEKKKSSANSDVDESYMFDLPDTWSFTSWGKLTEWITYGFTRPMPAADRGVKLVTAKDVLNFSIRLGSAGFTTEEAFSELSDKDRPQKGDLLITKDGTIGRASLVSSDETFCINQSVAVCWLRSTSMNKRFIELVANTDFTQRFVLDKAKGMAIQHLSITDLAQCPVPVPPWDEQTEIVRRVDTLFAYADRLEARYKTARARVEKLTPALLAKAFRGELVPQDPNDEPAEALLVRLRATRQETSPNLRRGRKVASDMTMQVSPPST